MTGRRRQISYNGGSWPRWRRDGKEIFDLDSDRNLIAATLKPGEDVDQTVNLFASGIHTPDARFDVSTDGRRFLSPWRGAATTVRLQR